MKRSNKNKKYMEIMNSCKIEDNNNNNIINNSNKY